jgi:hypothetical protein
MIGSIQKFKLLEKKMNNSLVIHQSIKGWNYSMDGRVVHRHRVSPKLTIVKHNGTLRFHIILIYSRGALSLSGTEPYHGCGCRRTHSKIEKKNRRNKRIFTKFTPTRQAHLLGFALTLSLILIMSGLVSYVAPVTERC